MRLKYWFESAWFDRFLIAVGLIECNFWSIESNFRSIENRSESFLKHKFFTCLSLFKLFQKVLSLSLWSVKAQSKIFCRFPSNFFKGFWLLRLVRPFCTSVFIYFHVSCICFMHFGKISNLRKIGLFVDFNLFFQNWSLGFCYGMLLNWS